MYDYDGFINSYIYILETDGEKGGFIIVENLKGFANAGEFSYAGYPTYNRMTDGSSDIDKIDWDAWKTEGKSTDEKLYYFGAAVSRGFFTRKDDETFIDLSTNGKYSYDSIKEAYDLYYRTDPSGSSGYMAEDKGVVMSITKGILPFVYAIIGMIVSYILLAIAYFKSKGDKAKLIRFISFFLGIAVILISFGLLLHATINATETEIYSYYEPVNVLYLIPVFIIIWFILLKIFKVKRKLQEQQ